MTDSISALGFVVSFVSANVAAASGQPGNTLALGLAIISLVAALGAALAPALVKRVRGASDVRDDKVAENTTLRSAAEVAMQLVDTTRGWAADLVAAMQQQIENLEARIKELEGDLQRAQETIEHLRHTASLGAEEYASELGRLRERERLLTEQKAQAEAEAARLRKVVQESEARIAELTLSPEAVQEHRDHMSKGEQA